MIYDKNISEKIIKNIFSILKLSGFKIFIIKLEGSKKNKTEKYLFQIIDFHKNINSSKIISTLSEKSKSVGEITFFLLSILRCTCILLMINSLYILFKVSTFSSKDLIKVIIDSLRFLISLKLFFNTNN